MNVGVLIALAVGTIIPGVTALITKDTASPKLKAVLTAGLSTLAGVIATVTVAPPHKVGDWEELGLTVLVSWAAAAGAYFAAWKPTGAAHALNTVTARFGLTDHRVK